MDGGKEWKNEPWGISIKYDSDWKAASGEESMELVQFIKNEANPYPIEFREKLPVVSISIIPTPMDVTDFTASIVQQMTDQSPVECFDHPLGGHAGKALMYTLDMGPNSRINFKQVLTCRKSGRDPHAVLVTFLSIPEEFQEYLELFDQMVDSVRLTEPALKPRSVVASLFLAPFYSKEHGFAFYRPSNWIKRDISKDSTAVPKKSSRISATKAFDAEYVWRDQDKGKDINLEIAVTVEDTPASMNAEEYAHLIELQLRNQLPNMHTFCKAPCELSGTDGVALSYISGRRIKTSHHFIIKDSIAYVIVCRSSAPPDDNRADILFHAMLSNFKLVPTNPGPYYIYENLEKGFQVKYPEHNCLVQENFMGAIVSFVSSAHVVSGFNANVSIIGSPVPKGMGLDDYAEVMVPKMTIGLINHRVTQREDIVLAGLPAKKIVIHGKTSLNPENTMVIDAVIDFRMVELPADKVALTLAFISPAEVLESAQTEFAEKILTSLVFKTPLDEY